MNRILPDGLDAQIDLSKIRIHPIFSTLKKFGSLEDADMLRTFNMGVGIAAVVRPDFSDTIITHMKESGIDAYEIGTVVAGNKQITFTGSLHW